MLRNTFAGALLKTTGLLRATNKHRSHRIACLATPVTSQLRYHSTTEMPFDKMEDATPKAESATKATAPKTEEQELPKLTPQEFRIYNSLAERMDMFHENFRRTWNLLYGACENGKRPQGMSIHRFLAAGDEFCHHLTIHHTIEEQHIFPVLAKKMPAFKKELELLTQHKQIHNGLDKFEEYLADVRTGRRDLVYSDMKAVMDTFGKVLWQHLDDEVNQLKAENMRKYWTLDEIRRIPM